MEEAVFELELTPLFYTQAPGHNQRNPRTKKLNRTGVLKRAVHFWWKGPSFSEATKNVDYDALQTTDEQI